MLKSVGIDLDGVVADFTATMTKVLRERLHMPLPEGYQPTDWGWIGANLPKGTMDKAWRILDATENLWMTIDPLFPNIIDLKVFFNAHAGKDLDVYFITARKDGAGLSPKTQSEMWLRNYLGNPSTEISVLTVNSGMDKVDVLHALSVDYCIDDHMPTVVNAKSAYKKGKTYLLDQPWNQDGKFYNVKRVNTLKEFFDIVENNR